VRESQELENSWKACRKSRNLKKRKKSKNCEKIAIFGKNSWKEEKRGNRNLTERFYEQRRDLRQDFVFVKRNSPLGTMECRIFLWIIIIKIR